MGQLIRTQTTVDFLGTEDNMYLEKNLMLYGSSLDTEGKYNQDVIVLMDGENIVGIWVSSEYGDEMQSDIGILSYLRSEF